MSLAPITETNFPDLNLVHRGKVRDLYDLGDTLLMVATDRISAFDVIMDDPIPAKGAVLTKVSLFWFDYLKDIVPNHLITTNVSSPRARCSPWYSRTPKGKTTGQFPSIAALIC